MTVRSSATQGREVREHYRTQSNDPHYAIASKTAMLRLIDRLEREFNSTDIWLMTSHDRLVLMNKAKDDGGPWLVMVQSIISDDHEICHRVPAALSPYPSGAWVHATARGIEEAVCYLKIAMRESEGWPTSTEL